MDEKKLKEYESRQKQVKANSHAEKRKVWLIWLAINIVIDVALFCWIKFLSGNYPFVITIGLVTTFLSLYIALKEWVELNNLEKQQLELLSHDEPMGRFRT